MAPAHRHHSKLEALLVDRIDQASLTCLHQQLSYVCGLFAASHAPAAHHLVLCVLTRNAQLDSRLKVLYELGRFEARKFMKALDQLEAMPFGSGHHTESQVKGLSSLVSYLSKQTQYETAETTITLVANSFSTFQGLADLLKDICIPNLNIKFKALVAEDVKLSSKARIAIGAFKASLQDVYNMTIMLCPADVWGVQLMCLEFMRSVMMAAQPCLQMEFPVPFCGVRSLLCTTTTQILKVGPAGDACWVCKCHNMPLHDPEAGTACCSVTGEIVELADCKEDTAFRRLGGVGTIQVPALLKAQSLQLVPQGSRNPSLEVLHAVKAEDVCDSLTFGRPEMLQYWSEPGEDMDAAEQNEAAFAALCKGLLIRREVLIARSQQSDLSGRQRSHLYAFYVLRPSADCSSMLAKRVACAEELLPASHMISRLAVPDPGLVDQVAEALASVTLPSFSPLAFSNRASEIALDLVSLDVRPHAEGGYSREGPSSRGAQPAISALKKQLHSSVQGSGCQTLGAKKKRLELAIPPAAGPRTRQRR